jgi:AbrB family looped-hinge helix DNA binding protein
MSKYAKIGKEGRILFPIDIRRKFNIKDGGKVIFEEDGDNIIIKPYVFPCKICDSFEDVNTEIQVCAKCIEKIKNL